MAFFARRLGNPADAADLTQQVFVRILAREQLDRITVVGAVLARKNVIRIPLQ